MDAKIKPKRVVLREELWFICEQSFERAVLLGQLIYWAGKTKDAANYIAVEAKRLTEAGADSHGGAAEAVASDAKDGWIYKGAADLCKETMLGIPDKAIRGHLIWLVERGFLSERKNPKYKWDRRLQYRLELAAICKAVEAAGYPVEGYLLVGAPPEPSLTNCNHTKDNFDLSISRIQQLDRAEFAVRNGINDRTISEITNIDYSETITEERNNPAPSPSAPVTSHLATAVTNKDSKTKTRPKRVDGFSDDGINELVAAWNEAIQGTSLSPVTEMTRTRKEQCRQRLQERPLNQWKEVFARVATSRFCKGGNDLGWRVTFSWLVRDDVNAVKVLEGEYDDRSSRLAAPPHRPAVGKSPTPPDQLHDNSHLW